MVWLSTLGFVPCVYPCDLARAAGTSLWHNWPAQHLNRSYLVDHGVCSKSCLYNVIHVVVFSQNAGQCRVRVKKAVPAEDGATHSDIDAHLNAGRFRQAQQKTP